MNSTNGKKPRARRWTYAIVAALVVAAAVAYASYGRGADEGVASYEVAAVARGPVSAKVTATGALSALVTVEVGSQVSGRIKEILVDYNAVVKKGQVLARIDPQLFDAELAQSRANFQAAEANLAKANIVAANTKSEYERSLSLAEQKLVSASDLDTARTNMATAQADVAVAAANLAQARAGLHQARVNLDYTTIASPIDGIVISRDVDVGQTVAASLQAPVLFTIAEDLRRMQVNTSVAEADVGKLTAGMRAIFTVDAYPSETFAGVVRQIRNDPQETQNVVTYDAVIDTANDDLRLKPGMTANVTFVYAERTDALLVPNTALRFRPTQGMPPATETNSNPTRKTVWIWGGDRLEPREIGAGISDGTVTEVVAGDLREGESVVTNLAGTKQAAATGARPPRMRGPF